MRLVGIAMEATPGEWAALVQSHPPVKFSNQVTFTDTCGSAKSQYISRKHSLRTCGSVCWKVPEL